MSISLWLLGKTCLAKLLPRLYSLAGALELVALASLTVDKLDENFGKLSSSVSFSFVVCTVGIIMTPLWTK